jgi:hypothetical protein
LHAVPEDSGYYSVLPDMSRSRFRSDLIANDFTTSYPNQGRVFANAWNSAVLR